MRILVVDDSSVGRDVVTHFCAAAGHDVESADGADAATAMIREGVYDCLIVDYKMPPTDGLEFLRWCRSAGVATPAILLSAIDPADLALMGRKATADGLGPARTLSKDFGNPAVLLALVAECASWQPSPA